MSIFQTTASWNTSSVSSPAQTDNFPVLATAVCAVVAGLIVIIFIVCVCKQCKCDGEKKDGDGIRILSPSLKVSVFSDPANVKKQTKNVVGKAKPPEHPPNKPEPPEHPPNKTKPPEHPPNKPEPPEHPPNKPEPPEHNPNKTKPPEHPSNETEPPEHPSNKTMFTWRTNPRNPYWNGHYNDQGLVCYGVRLDRTDWSG